ncbi:arylesterase [Motiliproteus sediminis]|uniref:arylesterase n=1 Tax=Motiliproteus sediminis TaxID=1468178 RepID=UPI001AEF6A8C|nr:arylesterase [Motiliproteus sediminis]
MPIPLHRTKTSRHPFAVWILLLALLTLTACSDDAPRLAPLSPGARVLAFGDSLTFGTGASAEHSYPAQLAQLTGLNLIRSGVPGEVSADGLARLPGELDTHQPQLLLLCHGGNDLLRKRDKGQLKANLRAMVQLARDRGIQVVLIGVPKLGLLLSPEPLYAELAEEMALPFEAEALSDILADNSLKSDAIHPNAAGYRALAERLQQLLKNSGAL